MNKSINKVKTSWRMISTDLDISKVKEELAKFDELKHNVARVYDIVTGGRVSNTSQPAFEVLDAYHNHVLDLEEGWAAQHGAESNENTFWYVFNPTGGPPRVRHNSEESARLEAERLAENNPGEVFQVLKYVASCHSPFPVPEWDDGYPICPF